MASMASTTPSGATALTTTLLARRASPPGGAWSSPSAGPCPARSASSVPSFTSTGCCGWVRSCFCSCSRASGTSRPMSWNSVPPSTTLSSCMPPQTPSTGMLRLSAPAHQRGLEGGAPRLQRPHALARRLAVGLGRDVEGAAGDQQPGDAVQVGLHARRVVRVRQHEGQPAGAQHRVRVGAPSARSGRSGARGRPRRQSGVMPMLGRRGGWPWCRGAVVMESRRRG